MMSETMKCPRCEGEMTEGFILDADDVRGIPLGRPIWFTQARWVEGKPEPSIWTGVKWSDKEAYRIAAWRCNACGLIELRATEPTKPTDAP